MADQMALTKPAKAGLPAQPNRAVRQQVPAFLNKLYAMVNDPTTDDLIHWSEEGDSFFASTLASIKRHQTALSAELKGLHDSDERLWQEAQSARKRLDQHQDTINRILKFLAGVFGNGAAGPGGHGARVREHAQGDNDGASDAGDGSTALVPRKRPRLMIEHSGSNEDVRPPPSSSKAKDKARISHAAQLEDDDDDSDWAEEHLLVPMDDHNVTPSPQEVKSPSVSTPRSSSHRRAPSEARIESVATSPAATSVPPTPGIGQVHDVTPTPPTQPNVPMLGTHLIPPTSTGIPQAPSYIDPQPNTLMNTQPYSLPSQALTSNPGYNTAGPMDPSSASDQAAWQNLLNSPTGMQMFLNAMAQPNP
ncbi:stress-responsive transcription factor hsf1, partial [Tulasnella sp. 417]